MDGGIQPGRVQPSDQRRVWGGREAGRHRAVGRGGLARRQPVLLSGGLARDDGRSLDLDYYIYDHFCENPGNQCFLLGGSACGACIASGATSTTIHSARCGQKSLGDMVSGFSKHSAQELYAALQAVGKPPAQVFDAIKLP